MANERTEAEERPKNEENARSQVRAMIRQAQGLRGQLSDAAQRAKGTASNDLSTAAASIAQTQQALEAAAVDGNVPEQTVAGLEAMLSSAERMAESAVQSATSAEAREGSSAAARELATATAVTRQVVQDVERDMFDRKIFDPYLHFNSSEEERQYREREAQRKKEIDEAMREHTPEGTLRAAEITREQLHEAGAHGATASPDYEREYQQLGSHIEQMKRSMARSAPSHSAAVSIVTHDPHEDMRRKLESQGVPPDTIAHILAAAEPIRAARQYTMAAHTDTHAAAAEAPAPSFEGEHAGRASAPGSGKKPVQVAGVTAGFDLSGLGLETKPATQAAESEKPQPAHPAQLAAIDLKGLGLGVENGDSATKGHGLPEQPKAADGKSGGRSAT